MSIPISSAKGIIWPALTNPANSLILSLLYQLEESQWWSPEKLEEQQMLQMLPLLAHAYQTIPFYQKRLGILLEIKDRMLNFDDFRQIPTLTRQDLQKHGKEMISTAIPESHLPIGESKTSGSTGTPVSFRGTKVTGVFYRVLNLRSHLWHKRNLTGKLAAIRVSRQKLQQKSEKNIIKRWVDVFPSGVIVELDSGKPLTEQLTWLQKENPDHLLTYPSNLLALAKKAQELNIKLPKLQELSTFGEVITPEIRKVCREVWNLSVVDIYSCQEMGVLALQCPETENYHIQSENVIVEVLNDNNQPCQPGEIGKLVITDIHNYAMPLIRYEIGDYAEVGETCSCGRGLPVLRQILGRTRNMIMLPSGQMSWPSFILYKWAVLGPINQIQVIQRSIKEIEFKMVVSRPMTTEEEESLRQQVCQDFGYELELKFKYVEEIPRSANGKYEDFISEVI